MTGVTTTTGMPSLDVYAEEVELKYPLLGKICWYSVSDIRISERDLENLVATVGLSSAFNPPSIQSQDAFRKAAKSAERKRVTGSSEAFEVVEVECEDWGIVCHIVQRMVNASRSTKEKLQYTTDLGVVTYYRPDDVHPHGRIEVINNAPVYDSRLIDVVNEMGATIKENFEDYAQFYHGNAIRSMITRILKSCSTITVRSSGGVYFSPNTYKETISRLKVLMTTLNTYPGSRCEFHHLPLIDERDQRSMLLVAFEDESVVEVERSLDEIAVILKSGKDITQNRYAKFLDEYHELKSKSREYSDLLGLQMDRTGDALIMFDKQIAQLLNKVKAE